MGRETDSELSPGGQLYSLGVEAQRMMDQIGELDVSEDTQTTVVEACAKVIEATKKYEVEYHE